MNYLTDRQKSLLTPEAELLITADYLNLADGTLTSEGRSAMWLILLEKYQKEIVVSAKQAIENATAKDRLTNAKKIIADS